MKDTLAASFKQSDVREQYAQSKLHVHSDMVLNDVNDGKYVKKVPFYKEHHHHCQLSCTWMPLRW